MDIKLKAVSSVKAEILSVLGELKLCLLCTREYFRARPPLRRGPLAFSGISSGVSLSRLLWDPGSPSDNRSLRLSPEPASAPTPPPPDRPRGEEVEKKGREEDKKEEEEIKKEEDQETAKGARRLDRPGGISRRLIYSTVAGGSFILILVLVVAVTISNRAGESSDHLVPEDVFCPEAPRECLKDWIRVFSKCYLLSMDQKPWNDSQQTCRSLGANLATFQNQEEMEFLMKRIGTPPHWFGLIHKMETSSWTWIDGSPLSTWLLIEGAGCAQLSHNGVSSDSCMSSRNYICSKEDRCS
ncbi:killer cell lectin-like receptor subfamily B member 1A [Macrotis lagotis]|uniref:killer cell lectin-like receptor subfamily B member 1A n=1 Tax=Macrotis lagotis TaxID=92651 RepID=UPI003D69CDE5